MERTYVVLGVVVILAALVTVVVVVSTAKRSTPSAQPPSPPPSLPTPTPMPEAMAPPPPPPADLDMSIYRYTGMGPTDRILRRSRGRDNVGPWELVGVMQPYGTQSSVDDVIPLYARRRGWRDGYYDYRTFGGPDRNIALDVATDTSWLDDGATVATPVLGTYTVDIYDVV